jgi:hypothetical protein
MVYFHSARESIQPASNKILVYIAHETLNFNYQCTTDIPGTLLNEVVRPALQHLLLHASPAAGWTNAPPTRAVLS